MTQTQREKKRKYEKSRSGNPLVKYSGHHSNFKHNYGIGVTEYRRIAREQGQKCAICGTKRRQLLVDHCHSSGRIRGLLCHACNQGLGNFKDNIAWLLKAIKFIVGSPRSESKSEDSQQPSAAEELALN
jgi:hypothetical protein